MVIKGDRVRTLPDVQPREFANRDATVLTKYDDSTVAIKLDHRVGRLDVIVVAEWELQKLEDGPW